jgi:energy-coupling factor transport system ATP-binding protein
VETFEIRDLTFTYPGKEKPAVDGVNLSVGFGEFIVLCGKSGCGKTTLLRNLKTVLAPHGTREGSIKFYGRDIDEVGEREQAGRIGFVLQSAENQIVTDKVWHELAFGLESLGYDNETIRIRTAEMASYFGIQTWFPKKIAELSGGQKQLLNLASVMVMQPDVLILDEPTSQLDPIAAADFLDTVKKINRDIGTTVILTEQRLEGAVPMADRVVVMDDGRIIADDDPGNVGAILSRKKHDMLISMPAPLQTYGALYEKNIGRDLECPLDVCGGRNYLTRLFSGRDLRVTEMPPGKKKEMSGEPAVEIKDTWFRYEKNSPDVIKDLSMKV